METTSVSVLVDNFVLRYSHIARLFVANNGFGILDRYEQARVNYFHTFKSRF